MYEAFDEFLARDTWHTAFPLEHRVFYRCLDKVVRLTEFNPDNLGAYIRAKKGISRGSTLEGEVQRWIANAWIIKEFLAVTEADSPCTGAAPSH